MTFAVGICEVKATVPDVAGKSSTVVPATAGACKDTVPDVSPAITNELMSFP
jgi:hypothetical protein